MDNTTDIPPIKKEWATPFLECLSINKTKNGDFEYDTEGSWWIFTWGPS